MSLFEKRYSKEEIFRKISEKRKSNLFITEYFGIPKDLILLPCLVVVVFVFLPLWLIGFAPCVILYSFYKYPKLLKGVPPIASKYLIEETAVGEFGSTDGIASDMIPLGSRTYDIVVFGVTGHSGSLLAEYLIERYIKSGKGLKMALPFSQLGIFG